MSKSSSRKRSEVGTNFARQGLQQSEPARSCQSSNLCRRVGVGRVPLRPSVYSSRSERVITSAGQERAAVDERVCHSITLCGV
jgi:hypothetical protein